MTEIKDSGPLGFRSFVDLTEDSYEPSSHNLKRQVYVFSSQPPPRSFTGRSRSPFTSPYTKTTPVTTVDSRRYSTIATIQLPSPLTRKPDNHAPFKIDKQSDEFIDITTFASRLYGNTHFHRVDGSQLYLSNKQVNWNSRTSPLHVRCVKCITNMVTRAAFPCGHLCLCGICGYNVFSSKQRCPVCNEAISNLAVYSWLG